MTADQKLEAIAAGVQEDIAGNEFGEEIDTNFDLYIEELRNHVGTRVMYGVIDMGGAYQGVYEWDGARWHRSNEDPVAIRDRIIRHRRFNS